MAKSSVKVVITARRVFVEAERYANQGVAASTEGGSAG